MACLGTGCPEDTEPAQPLQPIGYEEVDSGFDAGFDATPLPDSGPTPDGVTADGSAEVTAPDAALDTTMADGAGPDATDVMPPQDADVAIEDATPDQTTVADAPPVDVGPTGPPATVITLRENRPHVAVEAMGAPVIDFLIDTGAPLTALDVDHFGGSPASITADFTTFGETFQDVACARYDLFGPLPDGAFQVVAGILGSGFFAGRVLTLDYRNSDGYLFDSLAEVSEIPVATASPTTHAFTLEGGGNFQIPGDGTFSAGATRIVMQATLEGQPVTVLLDTGAAYSVIKPALYNSLDLSNRPALDGVRVIQSGQNLEATMTRAASLGVGDAIVTNTPMLVATNGIFNSLENETGAPIQVFLGGTWLRHFLIAIDYSTTTLQVGSYTTPDHINPNEWIGPGFRVNDGPNSDFLVYDVYDGTDAAGKGVQVNWRLAEFDGQPTSTWSTVEAFRDHLSSFAPGTPVDFGFRDAGDPQVINTISILIQDLLPAYTP